MVSVAGKVIAGWKFVIFLSLISFSSVHLSECLYLYSVTFALVCVYVRQPTKAIFVFFLRPLLFPSGRNTTWALNSEYKLTILILQTGRLFYHMTSYRKLELIQKPSAQIPRVFNHHGITKKQKFRYKCFKYTWFLANWPKSNINTEQRVELE